MAWVSVGGPCGKSIRYPQLRSSCGFSETVVVGLSTEVVNWRDIDESSLRT